jgi:energy-converting hydrogenase Eha subunit A
MNRAAWYATAIVVAHLIVNIVHGLAHRDLGIGLAPIDSIYVVAVILILPLIAMGLTWTTKKRLGLVLLLLSMSGALVFGLYHHFLATSADYVHAQPASPWGTAFVLTAYGLLITEALGAYVGFHFLWISRE